MNKAAYIHTDTHTPVTLCNTFSYIKQEQEFLNHYHTRILMSHEFDFSFAVYYSSTICPEIFLQRIDESRID